jgi:hypothetical protein
MFAGFVFPLTRRVGYRSLTALCTTPHPCRAPHLLVLHLISRVHQNSRATTKRRVSLPCALAVAHPVASLLQRPSPPPHRSRTRTQSDAVFPTRSNSTATSRHTPLDVPPHACVLVELGTSSFHQRVLATFDHPRYNHLAPRFRPRDSHFRLCLLLIAYPDPTSTHHDDVLQPLVDVATAVRIAHAPFLGPIDGVRTERLLERILDPSYPRRGWINVGQVPVEGYDADRGTGDEESRGEYVRR